MPTSKPIVLGILYPWWWWIVSNAISWSWNVGAFVYPTAQGLSFTRLLATNNDNNIQSTVETWKKGGAVDVTVTQTIATLGSTSEEDPLREASNRAREAWLEYHWNKGGGLPIVIFANDDDDGNDGNTKRRWIAPVGMKEEILVDNSSSSSSDALLEYTVTAPGPLFADLVPGSHLGRVTFSSEYDTTTRMIRTTLTWKVAFETTQLSRLYQTVTEFTVGTACRTVAEALATPRLLTLTTHLACADPTRARGEWLDFLFSSRGGGLPLPPPIPFGDVLSEGGGTARRKILRFPPGLVETAMVQPDGIAETVNSSSDDDDDDDDDEDVVAAYYRLENPGWWTLPFLVHTHLGRATFRRRIPKTNSDPENVELLWEVEIRPYQYCGPFVELLTEMTITTIVRNLRVLLDDEPGAAATVSLGSVVVPKATWVGRVLDARSSNQRSTLERTTSLFQPWTWGVDDPKGTLECIWSDGIIVP